MAAAQKTSNEVLRSGREKSSEMIALAEKRANQVIEEAKVAAQVEAERIVAAAKLEAAQEAERVKKALREQVSLLAVAGAEKILKREIDAQAHAKLLASLKEEL